MAFALTYGLLLTIPYVGPLTCIVAHAAAPLALVELMLDTNVTKSPAFEGLLLPSAPPAIENEQQLHAVVGDERAVQLQRKDKAG